MAEGMLPPVIATLTASISEFQAKMAEAKASMAETAGAGEASMGGLSKFGGVALAGISAAAVGISVAAVKMAGDFQESMTHLVVGAGESEGAIKGLSQQVLGLAGKTAQAPKDLAAALYPIESVGFHGAEGIKVLKAAAEGATASGAQLGTVADALAGSMHAFNLKSSDATSTVNTLQAAVASGKMHLDDLAGALGTVGPIAATAHVSLQEVTAAMATMTSSGTPAAQAATFLKQTIAQLENPTKKARDEMEMLGLKSIQVSDNLGKNGLASTMTMLTDAIQNKMGPAGHVLIKNLQQGKLSAEEFQAKLALIPATEQTYISALATMVGGTKSMQAALELTGPHMDEFKKNFGYISEQAKAGGGQVAGFALATKDFNVKVKMAEESVKAWLIQLGLKLIPIVEAAVSVIAKIVSWFTKHKEIAEALGIVIGGVLVAAIGAYVVAVGLAVAATILWWLTFNAATLGIGIAITAVVAGILYVATHWKQVWGEVTKIFGEVVAFVKQHVLLLLGIFFPFLIPIILIAQHWKQIWSDIQKWTGEAIDGVISFISSLPEKMAYWAGYAIGAYLRFWWDLPGHIWDALMVVLHFLEDFIPKAVGWAGRVGIEVVSAVVNFFASLPGRVWDLLVGGAGLLAKIVEAIPHLAGAAVDLGAKILDGIGHFILDIPGMVARLADAIWKLLTGAADAALKAAAHLGSAIWNGFKKGLGLSSPSHLERAMDTIIGNLQDKMGPLKDVMGGVNGLIPGSITGPTVTPVLGALGSLGFAGGAAGGDTTLILQVDNQALGQIILNSQLLRNRRNQSSTINVGLG